jgi:subtilase family serine protease
MTSRNRLGGTGLPHTRFRALAAASAALAVVAAAPALASAGHGSTAGSAAGASATTLAGAVPSWALGTKPAAAEPATATVTVALLLKGRDEPGLRSFDAAVSNPSSPSYRHFLTQAQYAVRYAPLASEASATRSWLQSAGLTVDGTTPHNSLVVAHGTAATVARAFHTSFGRFDVNGSLLRAPTVAPSLPASLRSTIVSVSGLAQTEIAPDAAPAPAFVNARPCSKHYGQKVAHNKPKYDGHHQDYAVCGYTPKEIRSAYGVDKTSLTGKHATVGIVDAFAAPTVKSDTNKWSKKHHIPKLKKHQFSQVLYPGASDLPEASVAGVVDFDPQGWQGEETLDVEAVHTMAPAAKIVYYAGTNTSAVDPGLYYAEDEAVEGGKVQVVSNSWGLPDDSPLPSDKSLFNSIAKEAAAEGITLDFASGDDGDEVQNLGERSADFPATSPKVTAVGGTTIEIGHHGKRLGETYWGTEKVPMVHHDWDFSEQAFGGAGGGGVSTSYAEPSWQKGIVPSNYATYGVRKPGRVVPDVAMLADPTTGMLIGETMTFADGQVRFTQYRLGGTSVACPLFSGLVALAIQKHHGKGLGVLGPTLYKHAQTAKGEKKMFHDPTGVTTKDSHSTYANVRSDYVDPSNPKSDKVFTLRTLGNLGTLHQRKGYDDSTGLGSPKAKGVIHALK